MVSGYISVPNIRRSDCRHAPGLKKIDLIRRRVGGNRMGSRQNMFPYPRFFRNSACKIVHFSPCALDLSFSPQGNRTGKMERSYGAQVVPDFIVPPYVRSYGAREDVAPAECGIILLRRSNRLVARQRIQPIPAPRRGAPEKILKPRITFWHPGGLREK